MKTVPADYWDLGLLEAHVRLVRKAVYEDGRVDERRVDLPIPEETMDELQKLIGDGNATVTVGAEIKVAEDFKTAGSTAWVKLTCNQDLKTVLETREIATTLTRAFAQQGYEQIRHVVDKTYGRPTEEPPPLVIEVTSEGGPAKSDKPALPGRIGKMRPMKAKMETDPEPARGQRPGPMPRPILQGKNKPNFRR